jgi:hypothetical protein
MGESDTTDTCHPQVLGTSTAYGCSSVEERATRECLLTSPGKYVWVRRRRGGGKKKKNPSCSSMAKVRKPRSGHVPDVGMSCVTTCSSSLFEGYGITHHSNRSAVVTFSPKGPRQNWKTFKSSRDGPTFDMGGWGVFWLVLLRRNGGRSLSTLSEARPNTFAHFCKVTPNTLAHPSNTLAHPSTLPLVGALKVIGSRHMRHHCVGAERGYTPIKTEFTSDKLSPSLFARILWHTLKKLRQRQRPPPG